MFDRLHSWREDRLLRGVVKNSSYLFSSNTISAALGFFQTILATRLLGIEGLGLVTTILTFVSNINRLLSFRMTEVTVRHFNQVMAEGKTDEAAALAKGIALLEAVTSVAAYLVLGLCTPWAARFLAKNGDTAPLFTFYGLVLLANLVYETSTGILQANKRFDRLALINLLQSVFTASLILGAFLFKRSLLDVLEAYLFGKAFAGIAVAVMAFRQLNTTLGRSWWRVPVRRYPHWRGLLGFAVNTNLNGTINLFTRDLALNLLAWLRPTSVANTEVGYFKLALTVINIVMLPIEPFIWPTYAEITRTIAQRQWDTTRRLLRRVSTIAGVWTLAAGGGIALIGWWLIPFVFKPQAAPAYPAVLILLIGYGFANIFNWNRPLLLALGKPGYPLLVAMGAGVVELALALWLVPQFGYLALAAVLSGFFVVSIGLTVWRGLDEIRRQSSAASP